MRRSTFCAAAGTLAAAAVPWPVRAARPGSGLEGRAAVPVVRARVGTHELVLAIDTGNGSSTLSSRAADLLGLAHAPIPVGAAAGATLRGVELAGATLRDHAAVLIFDDAVAELRGLANYAIDGSLGYDAFKDRAVTIDYAGGRLLFPEVMPDGEITPITWQKYTDRSPQLVTFDGLNVDGFPVTAQLDTMMSKNAIIFTTKLPDLAVDAELRAPNFRYEEATLRPGRVGSLRLGVTLLAAHPIVYSADASAHVPTTAIAVVVGDALFSKRAVTIDFPGSALIVT
jgi:hypothetical protein